MDDRPDILKNYQPLDPDAMFAGLEEKLRQQPQDQVCPDEAGGPRHKDCLSVKLDVSFNHLYPTLMEAFF